MAVKLSKDLKEKTNIILGIKGIDYNEWLNEQHKKFVEENEKEIWELVKNGYQKDREEQIQSDSVAGEEVDG